MRSATVLPDWMRAVHGALPYGRTMCVQIRSRRICLEREGILERDEEHGYLNLEEGIEDPMQQVLDHERIHITILSLNGIVVCSQISSFHDQRLVKRTKYGALFRMDADMPLEVVFYRTESGSEAVRAWLPGLSEQKKG